MTIINLNKENSSKFKNNNEYTEGLKVGLPRCCSCCFKKSEFCLISEKCIYHHPSDEELEILLEEIEESRKLAASEQQESFKHQLQDGLHAFYMHFEHKYEQ